MAAVAAGVEVLRTKVLEVKPTLPPIDELLAGIKLTIEDVVRSAVRPEEAVDSGASSVAVQTTE